MLVCRFRFSISKGVLIPQQCYTTDKHLLNRNSLETQFRCLSHHSKACSLYIWGEIGNRKTIIRLEYLCCYVDSHFPFLNWWVSGNFTTSKNNVSWNSIETRVSCLSYSKACSQCSKGGVGAMEEMVLGLSSYAAMWIHILHLYSGGYSEIS